MEENITASYLAARKGVIDRFFNRMNPRQKEALFAMDGPVLILAGAGSGKTTVMVNRIANMIRFGDAYNSNSMPLAVTEQDVSFLEACLKSTVPLPDKALSLVRGRTVAPHNILAITFTNKAANELRDRLAVMLGEESKGILAATFHSACVRILRQTIQHLGYGNDFSIYDTDDSTQVMKSVLKLINVDPKDFPPKEILGAISRAKDRLLTPAQYAGLEEVQENFRFKKYAEAYKLYQEQLRLANALDFDDLIMQTVLLFRKFPAVLERYQDQFRYILVDEYQDTSIAQFELVRLLADKYHNICVVGDDDQSIYAFRGATIENILQFESAFPGASVFRLEQNYRSTATILAAANAVIENNTARKGKTLWTVNGDGDKLHVYQAEDEMGESRYIAEEIKRRVAAGDKYSQFVVLYRVNAQSQVLERRMVEEQIPYRIVGGLRFYDRKEVKDMLAYLTLLVRPDDTLRLRRIINTPRRGIGDSTVETLVQIVQSNRKNAGGKRAEPLSLFESDGDDADTTLFEVMAHADRYDKLYSRTKQLTSFVRVIRECAGCLGHIPLGDVMMKLAKDSGYIAELKKKGREGLERLENIDELRSAMARYEETAENPSLESFLEEVALYSEPDKDKGQVNRVTLMTIHASKGLEFDTVFLAGMDENLFPHRMALNEVGGIEEERRLAYVAITRAERQLHIIYAECRTMAGRFNNCDPSRFLEEIPRNLYEVKVNDAKRQAELDCARTQIEVTGTSNSLFVPGDRVRSKAFGDGWIIAAEPKDGDWKVVAIFDKHGEQEILCASARLDQIEYASPVA